jgi:hypothetical protein
MEREIDVSLLDLRERLAGLEHSIQNGLGIIRARDSRRPAMALIYLI